MFQNTFSKPVFYAFSKDDSFCCVPFKILMRPLHPPHPSSSPTMRTESAPPICSFLLGKRYFTLLFSALGISAV